MEATSDLPPPYCATTWPTASPAPASSLASILEQLSQSSKDAKAQLKRRLKGVHRLGLWVVLSGSLLFAVEVLQLLIDSHFSALIGVYCGFLQILSGAFAIAAYKQRSQSRVIVGLVFGVLACIATFIGVMASGFGEIPMYLHAGRYHRAGKFSFARACFTLFVCLCSFVLVIVFSGALCRRSCCEKAPHILPVVTVSEGQAGQLQRQIGRAAPNVVMVTASSGEGPGVLRPALGFDGLPLCTDKPEDGQV